MRASEASNRHKVVIVGPCESGKSIIANVIAEAADSASEAYRPTSAVRILECETEVRSASSGRMTVELWDVSGDTKFQKCWPAIKKDAVGCILVYNPEKQNHEEEVEKWFQWFPRSMNFSANQVLVIQSLRRSDVPRRTPLPAKLAHAGVAQPATVSADDLVSARKHFGTFLETVRQSVLDKQRQEEEDVMKGG
jgi:Rab-like protein 5